MHNVFCSVLISYTSFSTFCLRVRRGQSAVVALMTLCNYLALWQNAGTRTPTADLISAPSWLSWLPWSGRWRKRCRRTPSTPCRTTGNWRSRTFSINSGLKRRWEAVLPLLPSGEFCVFHTNHKRHSPQQRQSTKTTVSLIQGCQLSLVVTIAVSENT